MKTWSALLVAAVPMAATLLVACDKGASNANVGAASSASASAQPMVAPSAVPSAVASAPTRPKNERRSGLAGSFLHAAHDIELKPEQKASLEKLDGPRLDETEVRNEMKASQADLIAGLKAGKMDMALMQKHYAALDKNAQAHQDRDAETLNGLHAALDAAQRKQLVAAVRAAYEAREGRMPNLNAGDAGAAEWTKKRLERMTKELDLDAAQQKSVGALILKGDRTSSPAAMEARKAESRAHMEALTAAFPQDTFDAKKLTLNDVPPNKAHEGMDHEVQLLVALSPLLKPEQREKLASGMDHSPRPNGGGRPHVGDRPRGRPEDGHDPHAE